MTKKGPFMEFLRASVNVAGGTDTAETEMICPTSRTETMAMLIHMIESKCKIPNLANGEVMLHLADRTHTDIQTISDQGVLHYRPQYALTTPAQNRVEEFDVVYFDPPILYPKASMFLFSKTVATAANRLSHIKVGYTLEKVSREDFIAALVE